MTRVVNYCGNILFALLPLIAASDPGATLLAKESVGSSLGEVEFNDSLNLDESAIDSEFLEEKLFPEDVPSFFDDFTFKLSQQLYAQVNNSDAAPDANKRSSRTGIEDNRLNLLIKYQNPFAAGWLIQGSSQAKLFWPGDYEYGAHNDPGLTEFQVSDFIEFRINEVFIQRSFVHHSFKLGRQTVVWGEVVGNSILDILNTIEFRDLSVIEIEDARLNQWMLRWDNYDANHRVSTFFNFYPEFNPQPRQGSPLFVELPFNLKDPERDKYLFEIGSQIRWSFEASDISLMAAYLYENQLRFEPPSALGDTLVKENDYWLVGASINRAIGKLLLQLDLAYNHGVLADTLSLSQVPSSVIKNQLGASFGFEYAISNDQNISASVLGQFFLNQSDDLAVGEGLVNNGIFGRWLIRYGNRFFNGDLVLSSTMNGFLEGDTLLASLILDYTIDDNWSFMGQVILTWASAESPIAVLDQDVRLGLTVTYSF